MIFWTNIYFQYITQNAYPKKNRINSFGFPNIKFDYVK